MAFCYGKKKKKKNEKKIVVVTELFFKKPRWFLLGLFLMNLLIKIRLCSVVERTYILEEKKNGERGGGGAHMKKQKKNVSLPNRKVDVLFLFAFFVLFLSFYFILLVYSVIAHTTGFIPPTHPTPSTKK